MGEAPLAVALKSLTTLAEVTRQSAAIGTLDELSAAYQTSGWTADAAVLESLSAVQSQDDLSAVRAVIQSLYRDQEVKDFVADYGHIIVDECHHLSAVTFEKV
ncbi:MAG: hypothetical protein ACKPHU_08920, partial [Planctomycetaceae bacterium]